MTLKIDPENFRWASEVEFDPVSGLANRTSIPEVVKTYGLKRHMKSPRQWENEWRYQISSAVETLANASVTFKSLAQAKNAAELSGGAIVETQGYYESNDGGGARYIVHPAGTTGVTVDGFRNHLCTNGQILELLLVSDVIYAAQFGVNASQPANADALQACINFAEYGEGEKYRRIILPAGEIMVEKTVTGSNVEIRGQGWWATQIQWDGDYTVFEVKSSIVAKDFLVMRKDWKTTPHEGIAFGTPRSDETSSQLAYSSFENIYCYGADFSWWLRASIWVNWKNCYSNSTVGIRFARNADPYDVTSPAPRGWNIFGPTLGWFHNVNRIDNFISVDREVGIWGCCMGTVIHATTQGQNGDKATNTILPTDLDRTGVYIEGPATAQSNWNNTITYLYTEFTDVPLRAKDCTLKINAMFTQGGSLESRARAVIIADQSTIEIDSGMGQDWFFNKCELSNNSTVTGDIGCAVVGEASVIDSTSRWNRGGRHEAFIDKQSVSYASDPSNTWPTIHGWLVPDGISKSLGGGKLYEVTAHGVFNGSVPYMYNYKVSVETGVEPVILLESKVINGGGFTEVLDFVWSAGADVPFFKVRVDFPHTVNVVVRRVSDMRSFTSGA